MCWDHLPWNEKCGCRFLGMQSTTIYKCQNRYTEGFRTLYVHYGDLWYSVMAVQVNLNAGCPWKRWPSPPCVLPAAPRGRQRPGAQWGAGVASQADRRPALVPQGRGGSATSPLTPAPAQPLWKVRVKPQPRCASSASHGRLRLLMERSLVGSESLCFSPVTRLGFPSPFSLFLSQLGRSFHRN